MNLPHIPLVEFLCLVPQVRSGPLRAGKGNGDASARAPADTLKYASFLRAPRVHLCVFVRCVRSHAAGAHEGTVHYRICACFPRVGQRHPPCASNDRGDSERTQGQRLSTSIEVHRPVVSAKFSAMCEGAA